MIQTEFESQSAVQTLPVTPHHENETLFWIKASAALGLDQVEWTRSVLPYSVGKARQLLRQLVEDNLPGYEIDPTSRASIYSAWAALCEAYGPIFFEKSPHHVHQWSSLELMLECETETGIESRFIGLVRNPMDTLYSMWTRWRVRPENSQYEWLRAYRNLLEAKRVLGDRMMIVRYEDLAGDERHMRECLAFAGIDAPLNHKIHSRSIQKWTTDDRFGFVLDPEVIALAMEYGYARSEMENKARFGWWATSRGQAAVRESRRLVSKLRKGF